MLRRSPMPPAILAILFLVALSVSSVAAQPKAPKRTIGLIASLTSFAASYGNAVREGAELAVAEANAAGEDVALVVEDDQSNTTQAVNAYQRLRASYSLDGVVGGSWWIDGIVRLVERDGIPLISNETLFNRDTQFAPNSFLLQGDVGTWVDVYAPLVERLGLRRAAMIRFTSGFALRLEERMRALFGLAPRTFLGSVEYAEIQALEAATIALKVKQLTPDVVYIDAQPAALPNLVRKLRLQGLSATTILTHTIARDAFSQGLLSPAEAGPLYYIVRSQLTERFSAAFQERYKRAPNLNADLGYYSIKLLLRALDQKDPVAALRSGMTVDGIEFRFDQRNVFMGQRFEIWSCQPEPCHRVEL